MEHLAGTAWILLQDIGAFTTFTEQMEARGEEGAEQLGHAVRSFFRRAEERIRHHGGRVISLVGDAYWALLPPNLHRSTVRTLAHELLNLPTFQRYRLTSRVIAVRGPVRLAVYPSGSGKNWILGGFGVDVAIDLEDTTEAGRVEIREVLSTDALSLPVPFAFTLPPYPIRLLDLDVAFVGIPEEEDPASVVAFFQERGLWLAKWVPSPRDRVALVVGGFPYATGRETWQMAEALVEGRRQGWVLRAGVSRGRILTGRIRGNTFEEMLFLGDTVNVAARLLGLAGEKEILLGNVDLPGGRVRPVGPVRVKGRERPVFLSFLEDLRREKGAFRLPFLGREKEVQEIRHHLVSGGRVAVMGPGGVGKTRLVEEALAHHPHPAVWVRGYAGLAPLSGLRSLVRSLPSPPTSVRMYLEGKTPVPREEVVNALAEWLVLYAPFTLVLDHLDGLDAASLQLFQDLVPRLVPNISVVVTLRAPHPFVEMLRMPVLVLPPLPLEIRRALIRSIVPDVSREQEAVLLRRCGDNLLCLHLALVALREGRHFSETTPFLSAIQHLSLPALRVVERLACAGVPLREGELPHLSERVWRELVHAGVVRTTPEGFALEGEPLQQAVVSSIPPSRRRRHYRRLADRASLLGGRDPEEIARWYTLARSPEKAASFWMDVVDQRFYQALHEELDHVERFLERQGGRFRALARLVRARRMMREGRYDQAEQVFQRLVRRKTFRKVALLNLTELYDWWERYDQMKACLVALFPYRHRFTPTEQVSFLELLGIWHDMQGQFPKALEWYRRCLAFARRHRLRDAESTALFNIGWIHQQEGRLEAARKNYLASLERGVSQYDRGAALLRLGDVYTLEGRFEEALPLYREALKAFQKIRFQFWEDIAWGNLSLAEAFIGQKEKAWADVVRIREESLREERIFLVALVLGDEEEVRRRLDRMAEPLRVLGEILLGRRTSSTLDPSPYRLLLHKVLERVKEHAKRRGRGGKNGEQDFHPDMGKGG